MIRVEEDNELVMDGELDEVVTEFGDIVSQYLRFMHDTHPIVGMAAEKNNNYIDNFSRMQNASAC